MKKIFFKYILYYHDNDVSLHYIHVIEIENNFFFIDNINTINFTPTYFMLINTHW